MFFLLAICSGIVAMPLSLQPSQCLKEVHVYVVRVFGWPYTGEIRDERHEITDVICLHDTGYMPQSVRRDTPRKRAAEF